MIVIFINVSDIAGVAVIFNLWSSFRGNVLSSFFFGFFFFLLYYVICPMGQKVKDVFLNKISENQICYVFCYASVWL